MSQPPAAQQPTAVRPASDEHAPGQAGHDPHAEGAIPDDLSTPSGLVIVGVVAAFVVLLAALFLVGYIPDHREQAATRHEAAERAAAKPVVQWTNPTGFTGEKDVTLPCDVTANQQTALYTRTNGYLKEWHYDLGARVEKGALMAVIETPEVDAQLEQSRATLEQNKANVTKAQADLELARVTLQRYVDAQKTSPGSVTQEDVDTRRSAYDDAVAGLKQVQASVTQAKANVDQLQTQVNFEKIYAPFSGTVTARNYDVGALLAPTDIGPGKEIFDLAQTDLLRVFVNVPQGYANNVKPGLKAGLKAGLKVRNFPSEEFQGIVTFTAGALDPNTRTLRVQIDFPNADGRLFAGEYGEVRLPVTEQVPVQLIPSSALIFNAQGLSVGTVGPGDKIQIKTVALGRDFGTELEVTSGLSPQDRVITNPGEQVNAGAEVSPHEQPMDDTIAHPKPGGPKPTAIPSPTSRPIEARAS